jgi:DNA repair protein SbcC/Rad50
MRILHLDLVNFKQYRTLSINFPDGLTGIVGSNGAGKSTLFDAVRCALFSEIPFVKEHLRSVDAGRSDPVSVELTFESGGKKYRVVREFRGAALTPQAKLYEDGNDECIATQQNPVTERVEAILGMSGDAFLHSVFSGQKELGKISEATGSDRRGLVREMLGMSRIDSVQKIVREESNERSAQIKALVKTSKTPEEIAALQTSKTAIDSDINKLNKEMDASTESLTKASAIYAAADDIFGKQHNLFTTYSAHKQNRDKALHSAESAFASRRLRSEELEKLNSEKKSLDGKADIPEKFSALTKQNESFIALLNIHSKKIEIEKHLASKREEYSLHKKKKIDLEKELAALSPEITKADELKKVLTLTEAELRVADEALQNTSSSEGEIKSKRDERAAYKLKLSQLGKDADCPLCKRPLAEQYDSVLQNLTAEIEQYEKKELSEILAEKKRLFDNKKIIQSKLTLTLQALKDISKLEGAAHQKKTQLTEVESRIETTAKEGDALNKELKMLGDTIYDANAHKELKQKLETAAKENEEFVRCMERVARIPSLEKEITILSEEHKKNIALSAAEESKMNECGFSAESYEKSIAEKNSALEERNRIQAARDILTAEKHNKEKTLMTVTAELARDAENREHTAALTAERDKFQRLVAIFDGFKNAILARVQPAIAGSASGLFSQMTGGRYGEIIVDENFDFHINDGGNLYPIKRFSGGEVDLANLCLRIAISRAIRTLSGGGSAGFLGFDEIFGSQDAERRHMVMDALNRLSDEYNQIFIVSHVDDVKDEFPKIIEVTCGADGSNAAYR